MSIVFSNLEVNSCDNSQAIKARCMVSPEDTLEMYHLPNGYGGIEGFGIRSKVRDEDDETWVFIKKTDFMEMVAFVNKEEK